MPMLLATGGENSHRKEGNSCIKRYEGGWSKRERSKNVTELEYLGTTLTNRSCIYEEIKSRLYSGNACYRTVQNLMSSSMLSTNTKKY
jgi:hypothetical protein